MSTPSHQKIEAALADLRVQQTRIREASEQLAKTTGTATSKDRAISATVDSQGKLTAVRLQGTGYRRLAPAEFAAALVDTIRSAQDVAARQATEALTGLLPTGLGLGIGSSVPSERGRHLDAMFEAAARAVREPLFADDAADARKGTSRG